MATPPPLPPPNKPNSRRARGGYNLDNPMQDGGNQRSLSPRPSWEHVQSPPTSVDMPPPIPPSARPRLNKSRPLSTASSISSSSNVLTFPREDDKFSLVELIDQYSNIFPVRVRVVKGFYDERRGEASAIAVDELYNFHFVKRSKAISISDVGGNKYVVPLNSATKFGVLYEHGNRTFPTVEDIIKAPVLPKVVCAQAGYVGNDEASSIDRHEILAIKEIDTGGRFRRFKAATLKVYSITKEMDKVLSKNVYGNFDTDSFNTQMYLPEFIKYIRNPIPTKVRLFLDFECHNQLPSFLISEDITINRLYIETSIIASPLSEEDIRSGGGPSNDNDGDNNDDGDDGDETQTIDIPINLDIEVSVIPHDDDHDDDYEKLTIHTMNILSNFDPASTTHHMEEVDDDDYSYTAQNQFFTAIRKGFEREGLNIETPVKIRTLTQRNTDVRCSSSPDEDGYEDVPLPDHLSPSSLSIMQRSIFPSPTSDAPQTSGGTPQISTPPDGAPRTSGGAPQTSETKSRQMPLPYDQPRPHPPLPPRLPKSSSTDSALRKFSYPLPASQKENYENISVSLKRQGKSVSECSSYISPVPTLHPPALPHPSLVDPVEEIPLPPPSPSPLPPPPPPSSPLLVPPPPSSSKPPVAQRTGLSRHPPSLGESKRSHDPPVQSCDSAVLGGSEVDQIKVLQTSMSRVTKRMDELEVSKVIPSEIKDEVAMISAELKRINPQLEKANSAISKLEHTIKQLQDKMADISKEVKSMSYKMNEEVQDASKSSDVCGNPDLDALNCEQILKLLDLLGLKKYRQTFIECGIDGSILSQCNDQLLEEELEIKSRIDRIKLTQVISGKRSIQNIYQKSYVTFEPRPG